jgi:2-iminobutanoate/2-iminopropanoate deaminase
MKETISTENGPRAIGPYSQAVVHGGLAYVSGQIPIDPANNKVIEGGISAQTERVLENIKAILEACGASLDSVLKTTVFLKDMGDFAPMNQTYERYFAKNPPARSTIQAARLPRDVSVEIDVIAAIVEPVTEPRPA